MLRILVFLGYLKINTQLKCTITALNISSHSFLWVYINLFLGLWMGLKIRINIIEQGYCWLHSRIWISFSGLFEIGYISEGGLEGVSPPLVKPRFQFQVISSGCSSMKFYIRLSRANFFIFILKFNIFLKNLHFFFVQYSQLIYSSIVLLCQLLTIFEWSQLG